MIGFAIRVPEQRRKHASFLLPSFTDLFHGRKRTTAPAAPLSGQDRALSVLSGPVSVPDPASDEHGSIPSYRDSIASASSMMTVSTTTTTARTNSTDSGSSGISPTSPSSLCTLPRSYSSSPGSSSFPSTDATASIFVQTLTAEPEIMPRSSPQPCPPSQTRRWSTTTTTTNPPPTRCLARVLPDTLRCRRCSADLAFAAQIVSKSFVGNNGRAYLVSPPATSQDAAHLYAPGVPASAFPRVSEDAEEDADDADDDEDYDDEEIARLTYDRARYRDDAQDATLGSNVRVGRAENRQLLTGPHVVADIHCAHCQTRLGWKYVDAREPSQRYKVGKFILEAARLVVHRSWEDAAVAAGDAEDAGSLEAARQRMRLGKCSPRTNTNNLDDNSKDAPVEFDSEDEDECEEIFAGTWDAATVAARRRSKQQQAMLR